MKSRLKILLVLMSVLFFLSSCQSKEKQERQSSSSEEKNQVVSKKKQKEKKVELIINPELKYQTIESFGASGAWWAQDVGGWKEEQKEGLSKRDYIAQLLFDREVGIGLTSYRYNLGAGSADSVNSPKITDPWRRSESFEVGPKVYDWSKDQNSQYMLEQAVSYGIEQIYFFANSPLERLTKNGHAYGSNINGELSNLAKDNYQEFIEYLFDVTEHFLEEGIPVKYLSPINEPQWEWLGGQEGAHFEPEEVVGFAKQIYKEKEKRDKLSEVKISIPELGEWSNSSLDYYKEMIEDKEFMEYYQVWDIHSYWSNKLSKMEFIDFLEANNQKPILKMSEWTEMVNGRDVTMDSAMNLGKQILQDLKLLNVVDWQYWIAVSSYDYRDGLIYVDLNDKNIELTKRLWVMGNFSKYVRPGFYRIEATIDDSRLETVAFQNPISNEVTIIILNNSLNDKKIMISSDWTINNVVVTSENKDLEVIEHIDQSVELPGKSVSTIQISKK